MPDSIFSPPPTPSLCTSKESDFFYYGGEDNIGQAVFSVRDFVPHTRTQKHLVAS